MKRVSTLMMTRLLAGTLLATSVSTASAQDTLRIGLLATLEGAFAVLGQDAVRGAELALMHHDGMAGGKTIEFVRASSNATPDSAVNGTRKLVEQDGVEIMVGPLSGGEGIAVKNYAKTQPHVTFINGSSGAQETTLVDPSPNFFRYNLDGAQVKAPLGTYAYEQGYRRTMVIAEDYGFPYSQVQGFMSTYCAAGGRVPHKAWVPIGTRDFSSVIATIPDDVDSLLVILAGSDAINFIRQYEQVGGDKRILAGSVFVDQTVLTYRGRFRTSLVGTLSTGWTADTLDTPEWNAFASSYRESFEDAFPAPSYFAYAYYSSVKAALTALDMVDGDLSDGHERYREALQNMTLATPAGAITLDENRQAVGPAFITQIVEDADNNLVSEVVKVTPSVDQYLNMSAEDFWEMGLGTRDVPDCP